MAKRSQSSRNHASATTKLTPAEQRQYDKAKKSDAIDLVNDTDNFVDKHHPIRKFRKGR